MKNHHMNWTADQRMDAALKIIRGTIKLYRSPLRWIRMAFAGHRLNPGTGGGSYERTDIDSDEADCFCLVGALRKTALELYGDKDVATSAVEYLGDVIQFRKPKVERSKFASARHDTVTGWNDRQTRVFSDVTQMLRRARDDFKPVYNAEYGTIDAKKV